MRVFTYFFVRKTNKDTLNMIRRLKKEVLTRRKKENNERKQIAKYVSKFLNTMINQVVKKATIEHKRLNQAPKTGMSAKGRNGSTRNGFVVSVSSYHRPVLTVAEIHHRNTRLQVNQHVCFWCKSQPATVLDHAHPCCSMIRSEFSWTNNLNIFPSCTNCNQMKSGKALSVWLTMTVVVSNWSPAQIDTFQNWLSVNSARLLFDSEYTKLTVQQFPIINKFHDLLDKCAKHKININDYFPLGFPEFES